KTNFKEWKQVLQELDRFLKAGGAYKGSRSLRYDNLFDSYPSNLASIARFHSKRVLKLKEAVLTSYRRNEQKISHSLSCDMQIKFTELTLDTFRILQCLEWEPTGSYQIAAKELTENGAVSDQSGPSGLIDIQLSTEISYGSLPSNPQKAIIYHPTVAHLLAVLATICEELSQDSILLIYISASGYAEQSFVSQKLGSSSSSRARAASAFPIVMPNSHVSSDNHLWLGPRGSGGKLYGNVLFQQNPLTIACANNLYPEDLIPFTRYPLFLVIDSENSHAFKAGLENPSCLLACESILKLATTFFLLEAIHNAEKGEPAALLLSPRTSSAMPGVESMGHGSQFTYFLTVPMQAFCQLAGITSNIDTSRKKGKEMGINMLIMAVNWFIFCRAVLFYFHSDEHEHLPTCLPSLPESVSPNAEAIKKPILSIAEDLVVSDQFNFGDSTRNKK
ncbi:Protein SCAI, partial [Zea mays]